MQRSGNPVSLPVSDRSIQFCGFFLKATPTTLASGHQVRPTFVRENLCVSLRDLSISFRSQHRGELFVPYGKRQSILYESASHLAVSAHRLFAQERPA